MRITHLDGSAIAVSAEHTPKARLVIERNGQRDTYQFTDTARDIFPLKYGMGTYTVKLCEPKYKNVYTVVDTMGVPAITPSWDTCPNQYVYYTEKSGCAQFARTLAKPYDEQPESEIIDAITDWIKSNIAYDYIREATIPKWGNVLPDIDRCFDQRRGICLDIAGMMVAMLRSRYIASRLEIGKFGGKSHAWVRLADGTLFDPTRDMVAQTRGKNCYKLERFY